MNEAIYRQPLVLFLGAGASQPLGLKTSVEFCESLKSDREIARFIKAAESYYKKGNTEVEAIDAEALLDFLEDLAKTDRLLLRYEKRAKELYREWADGLKASQSMGSSRRDYEEEPSPLSMGKYEAICNRIKDLVIKHYFQMDEIDAIKLYQFLWKRNSALQQPLPIFTTNYDLAIEKTYGIGSLRLIDGFRRERAMKAEWSRSEYEDYKPNTVDVILFKLHGSVDWIRTASGGIQRVDIPAKDPGGMQTVIAYPSRLKREIHEEPFRTNYDYLLACLLHAKLCAVIGFSFRDQEIVEEVRQAIELNKKLQLVIIDPNAESIKSQLLVKLGETWWRDEFKPRVKPIAERFTAQSTQALADVIAEMLSQ